MGAGYLTYVGLINVFYPIDDEGVGKNEEVQLQDQTSLLWCVFRREPVIPTSNFSLTHGCSDYSQENAQVKVANEFRSKKDSSTTPDKQFMYIWKRLQEWDSLTQFSVSR